MYVWWNQCVGCSWVLGVDEVFVKLWDYEGWCVVCVGKVYDGYGDVGQFVVLQVEFVCLQQVL